jgi:hypothetical protein
MRRKKRRLYCGPSTAPNRIPIRVHF